MAKPGISVEGLDRFRKAFKAAGGDIDDLKDANKEVGDIIVDRAQTLVPHRTGALEKSIRSARQAKGAIVRAGSVGVPYAGPVHFGWPAHGISPQPFLFDAIDDRVDEVIDVYERRVRSILDDLSSPGVCVVGRGSSRRASTATPTHAQME